jgi:hypothetical protein
VIAFNGKRVEPARAGMTPKTWFLTTMGPVYNGFMGLEQGAQLNVNLLPVFCLEGPKILRQVKDLEGTACH